LKTLKFPYKNDYEVSENLVQDTFVKVYTHGNSYKEISKFSTWIYTIAGNLAKTELRKLKRRKTYSFSQLSHEDREFSVDRHSSNDSKNDNERTYKYQQIKKAIPQLSEDFRNIIILRDIQELSYDEISKILEIPIGTIKSRINRGRIQLAEKMKHFKEN
jgi:RNA polymerase sigma-70 factor (ECF subfamily)